MLTMPEEAATKQKKKKKKYKFSMVSEISTAVHFPMNVPHMKCLFPYLTYL